MRRFRRNPGPQILACAGVFVAWGPLGAPVLFAPVIGLRDLLGPLLHTALAIAAYLGSAIAGAWLVARERRRALGIDEDALYLIDGRSTERIAWANVQRAAIVLGGWELFLGDGHSISLRLYNIDENGLRTILSSCAVEQDIPLDSR